LKDVPLILKIILTILFVHSTNKRKNAFINIYCIQFFSKDR
jgi:hypothetical protein